MNPRGTYLLAWLTVLAFGLLWLAASVVFGAPYWLTIPAAGITGIGIMWAAESRER